MPKLERNSKGRVIIKGETETIKERIYTGGEQIKGRYRDPKAQVGQKF